MNAERRWLIVRGILALVLLVMLIAACVEAAKPLEMDDWDYHVVNFE